MTDFRTTLRDVTNDTLCIVRRPAALALTADDGEVAFIEFSKSQFAGVADALVSALPEYLQYIEPEPEPEEWETADVVIADWFGRRAHFIRQGDDFRAVRADVLDFPRDIENMRHRNPVAVQIDGRALPNESEAA